MKIRYFLSLLMAIIVFPLMSQNQFNVNWSSSTQSLGQDYLFDENIIYQSYHQGEQVKVGFYKSPTTRISSNINSEYLQCFMGFQDTLQIKVSDLPYEKILFEIIAPTAVSSDTTAASGSLKVLSGTGMQTSTLNPQSYDGSVGGSIVIDSLKDGNLLFTISEETESIQIINDSQDTTKIGFRLAKILNMGDPNHQNEPDTAGCTDSVNICIDISNSVDSVQLLDILNELHDHFTYLAGTGVKYTLSAFSETYREIANRQYADSLLQNWQELKDEILLLKTGQVLGTYSEWPMDNLLNGNENSIVLITDGFEYKEKDKLQALLDMRLNWGYYLNNTDKSISVFAFDELLNADVEFFESYFDMTDLFVQEGDYRFNVNFVDTIDNISALLSTPYENCVFLAMPITPVEEENQVKLMAAEPYLDLIHSSRFSEEVQVQETADHNMYRSLDSVGLLEMTYNGNTRNLIVRGLQSEDALKLFPNPASDRYTVVSQFPVQKIKMINTSGKIVSEQAYDKQYRVEQKLQGIPPGNYFIEIYRYDKAEVVRKLVVIH